jgi:cytochrome c oxidase subunit I
MARFIVPAGAADFGWTVYTPLSTAPWITGLIVGGLGTILGAVKMITTVACIRAPGTVMFRMPIFTWNIFVTSTGFTVRFRLSPAAVNTGTPTQFNKDATI